MAADRLYMYSWYHGELGRAASEAVIQSKKHGVFLVRDSTTLQGGYVLSVSENKKVSHYIITHRNGQYQIGDQTFNDLPDIVEFYKRHFLDTTTLVEAAPRQTRAPAAAESEAPSELIKVRAKYNFPGNDAEDLPFKKNDILTILKKEEELWWMARDCTGKEGMIPVNYVDEITNRTSYTPNKGATQRTSIQSSGTMPGDTGSPSRGYMAPTDVTVPAIAEAIQDRHPTVYDPSELKFAKGDRILVLSMPDKGSWEGQLQDGRIGIFPFRYVKIITSDPKEVSKFKASTM